MKVSGALRFSDVANASCSNLVDADQWCFHYCSSASRRPFMLSFEDQGSQTSFMFAEDNRLNLIRKPLLFMGEHLILTGKAKLDLWSFDVLLTR